MRTRILGLVIVGLLAGCSADWQPQHRVSSTSATATATASGPSSMSAALSSRTPGGFAALPDRGDLLAYDPARPVRRGGDGAYTWHPVELSEAHALRAVGSGEDLVVTAPNGRPIRLRYERHIEHENGNWTWIGRTPGSQPGTEAILTFGDKAAFGSIPYEDHAPLRLTIAGGHAWLIETDNAKLARLDNTGTRPRKPDHLVPPRMSQRPTTTRGLVSQTQVAETAVTATATAEATTVVDLLLGYTNGFAARLGGQSQAVTRLTYLVDVTNQAYTNSQIPARVRLVWTQQVTYPDATDNEAALHDLSGCIEQSDGGLDCDFSRVPASLRPLLAAQDQQGADLVSLVRNFNDPENDGCGIAWLLGAGRTAIELYGPDSGLSVVSDSSGNIFPDNNYICRDETLAHELGHNMGSAHDMETAAGDDGVLDNDDYGRYTYSFGHKTAAGAGNFYTLMAYGDSGQTKYRVFSNPSIVYCGGYACGLANVADNARSLRGTIPTIAGFRASRQPVALMPPVDANGDGRSDVFWHSTSLQKIQPWLMNGATWTYGQTSTIASKYRVAGIGDFNGDGRADLVWRDTAGTELWLWQARVTGGYSIVYLRAYPAGWDVVGVGDANGDGRSDLFWHNATQQKMQVWLMNGSTWTYGAVHSRPGDYVVAGVGDFSGDGRADVLWRDSARTAVSVWIANVSGTYTLSQLRSYPQGWEVVGVRRANADNRADVFWHSSAQGKLQAWLMNGTTWSYGSAQPIASIYRVSAMGDFNGDGLADLVWRDLSNTKLWLWQAQAGGTYSIVYLRSYPQGWSTLN